MKRSQVVAAGEVVQQILDRGRACPQKPGCHPIRLGRIARQIQAWTFSFLTLETHATPCEVRCLTRGPPEWDEGHALRADTAANTIT